MLDVSVAYNRYKFLGYEFLTWIWYVMELEPILLTEADPDLGSLEIGNRIVLENRLHETVETVTIRGDDAGLEEGVLSLKKGAVVAEMNLCYKSGDHEWRFNLKGESLTISGLKTPDTGPVTTGDEVEGAVIEKAYLCHRVVSLVDQLFGKFIRYRLSVEWEDRIVPSMRNWIRQERRHS